jgi:hypothetical protein
MERGARLENARQSRTLKQAFEPGKLNDGKQTNLRLRLVRQKYALRLGNVAQRRLGGLSDFHRSLPGKRLSIVVLSNSAEFNPVQKGMKIARVFLDESNRTQTDRAQPRKIRLPKSWFWSSANRNELCLLLTRLN